jgi:hypothetical protein
MVSGLLPSGGRSASRSIGSTSKYSRAVVPSASCVCEVAVLALAADLVGVHASRLVAVVAVGDEQLGALERRLDRGDRVVVGHAPEAVGGALVVDELAEGRLRGGRLDRAEGGALRVGVQAEDRRQVRPGRAGEPQAVLARAGVRALVRADPPRAVVLDPHAREQAAAGLRRPVGRDVVLHERPDRRLLVSDDGAVGLPALQEPRRFGVGVAALLPGLRQVDADDVVRRALGQRGALLGVDDVVRRGDDSLQRADLRGVVVQGAQRLHVGHGGVRPYRSPRRRHRNGVDPVPFLQTGRGAAW